MIIHILSIMGIALLMWLATYGAHAYWNDYAREWIWRVKHNYSVKHIPAKLKKDEMLLAQKIIDLLIDIAGCPNTVNHPDYNPFLEHIKQEGTITFKWVSKATNKNFNMYWQKWELVKREIIKRKFIESEGAK